MKTITLLISLLSFLQTGFANEAPGPHGGRVVKNENHKFEVKLDPEANHIEVYTLNAIKLAPPSMAVTLFRDSGSGQTIDLKAVDLQDPLPKYQGELSPYSGSYVGAELRFEISLKSFEVLKFMPYMPPRVGPY